MKAQKRNAFAYMFRNFWHLLIVALPVAVLMSFFYNSAPEAHFFASFLGGKLTLDTYFSAFARGVTVLRWGKTWWCSLISLVVLAFCISLAVVKISRHMKIGEMDLLPMRKAFRLFPTILLYIFCFALFIELFDAVSVGVSYLVGFLGNIEAIAAIGVTLYVLLRALVGYMFGLFLQAIPLHYSENYKFNIAMSYSVRIMIKRPVVLVAFALIFSVGKFAIMGMGYFLEPFGLLAPIHALVYFAFIAYLPCLAYTIYYDSIGGTRRDLHQSVFGR